MTTLASCTIEYSPSTFADGVLEWDSVSYATDLTAGTRRMFLPRHKNVYREAYKGNHWPDHDAKMCSNIVSFEYVFLDGRKTSIWSQMTSKGTDVLLYSSFPVFSISLPAREVKLITTPGSEPS